MKNVVINNHTITINRVQLKDADDPNVRDNFNDTTDTTATANKLLNGETAYSNGVKITGNIQSLSTTTYTPTTTAQTIPSGKYLAGDQTISGDSNLKAENIKNGITMFGVTGNYTGGTPSGTKNITTTTLTDVAGFANAIVTDGDIVPENILENVNILGVVGVVPSEDTTFSQLNSTRYGG